MKKTNLILGMMLLVLSLPLLSSSAYADDHGLIDKINALLTEMENGRNAVSGNVRDAIREVSGLLQDNIQPVNQAACEQFRGNFTMLSEGMFNLGSSLVNFHGFSVMFELQDPGIADIVNKIPCLFLTPVEKVASKLPMFNGEFVYQLNNMSTELDLLKGIVFPSESPSHSNDIQPGPECEYISNKAQAVQNAQNVVTGFGYTSQVLSMLLLAFGDTPITGPDHVEGAVWGWAGVSIDTDASTSLGNLFGGISEAAFAVVEMVDRSILTCDLRNDLIALQSAHEALQLDHEALQLDHEALLAMQQALLANQESLKDGQQEIVHLLLTPHGRRSRD